jgi:glycosyltransferase involved in cell wall biosynthesis
MELAMTQSLKVAYIMSRFPKITETFILYEMLAVMQEGVQVEVYPLMRGDPVMHPEAKPLTAAAHYTPHLSPAIVLSNVLTLARHPRRYLGTLWTTLRATQGSRRFFTGILAFFWKSVHMGRLMQRQGINHMHAHFASFPAATAYIIHRLTGIPYSFTAHGSDLHRDQHFLQEKVADSAFTVAISEYNRRVILEHSGASYADRVQIVHCGVDTSLFRPADLNGATADRPLQLVCTGTLHEVKGQTYLIAACAELMQRGISFTCHLVGDGPDRPMLEAQAAAAGLGDRVVFHGNVLRERVVELLRCADIVVQPSVPTRDGRREGIPVATMEAMACGTAVVASALSGIPELIEDGVSGILVPPGDAAQLARTLEALATDPDRRARLGIAARQRIVDDFNLTRNAERLSGLFAEVTR